MLGKGLGTLCLDGANYKQKQHLEGPLWRKGWDSNPRWACTHGGFQDRCLKPLGHPSKLLILLAVLPKHEAR
jgi:hypothetical protein